MAEATTEPPVLSIVTVPEPVLDAWMPKVSPPAPALVVMLTMPAVEIARTPIAPVPSALAWPLAVIVMSLPEASMPSPPKWPLATPVVMLMAPVPAWAMTPLPT